MVVEGVLLVAGLVGTFVLGAPVAVALARPHKWLKTTQSNARERERLDIETGFTPLDFGPDIMRWPSERAWPESDSVSLDWPSKKWDDEHFGAHWREGHEEVEDLGFHAMIGRDPSMGKTSKVSSAPRRQAPAPAERRTAPRRPVGASPRPDGSPQSEDPTPVRPQRGPGSAPRDQVVIAPSRGAAEPEAPTKAQLEALVAEVGLAGTVKGIMDQTGWDFRRAAHYLARMRQGD